MKIRFSLWLMLAAGAGGVTLALWQPAARKPIAAASQPVAAPPVAAGAVLPPGTRPAAPSAASTTVTAPNQISAAVQVIVDGSSSFQACEQAIKSLGGQKLSDADRKALYDYLRQPGAHDDQQVTQVLKNELMDALCTVQPPPPGLRELLTQIQQNAGEDEVLRDYAVQHLSAFYRQMSSAAGLDATFQAAELQQTRQTLFDALGQTDTSMAGTALLGLSQLAQSGWPGVDAGQISAAALKLAENENAGELTRITAFQVCANLKTQDALPAILNAAQSGQTVPVQISAIAALGALGDASQIPWLNSLIQDGNNDRLRLPAQHALSQIASRLQPSSRLH
jgi:hypothetical protein